MLIIDRAVCTGCGVCMDICPVDAISLDECEGVASIDPDLCTECLACLEVCPNDAVQRITSSELVPAAEVEVVEGEVIGEDMVLVPEPGVPAMPRQPHPVVSLAGTALSFAGSWLLPRVADALVEAVERRLANGTQTPSAISRNKPSTRQLRDNQGSRPRQRRRRRRGR